MVSPISENFVGNFCPPLGKSQTPLGENPSSFGEIANPFGEVANLRGKPVPFCPFFVVFCRWKIVFGRFWLFFVIGKLFSVVFCRWKIVFGRFWSLKIFWSVCPVCSLLCMKRKSSSAQDREAKRQEIAQPISFSLESYEDYWGSDEETPLAPPAPPPPAPVAFRKKPGTKPILCFDEFARQQQTATALLMQMR